MARVIVEIDLGENVTEQVLRDPKIQFIEKRDDGEYVVIDDAYLTPHEDDSFFEFKLVEIKE